MTSKVLICPYFGDLPPWMDAYWGNAERLKEHGYNFLLDDDEDAFRDRVRDKLGIVAPPMANTGNIHDFRPALGYLYADEIAEYDFWGVTDFDCVYGRVERFYPDNLLAAFDVVTDHWNYLCGPWTLFRNGSYVNELFRQEPRWEEFMEFPEGLGWMEGEFTTLADEHLRVNYAIKHAWENPGSLVVGTDGSLHHEGREIPFFHFKRTKQWPL